MKINDIVYLTLSEKRIKYVGVITYIGMNHFDVELEGLGAYAFNLKTLKLVDTSDKSVYTLFLTKEDYDLTNMYTELKDLKAGVVNDIFRLLRENDRVTLDDLYDARKILRFK